MDYIVPVGTEEWHGLKPNKAAPTFQLLYSPRFAHQFLDPGTYVFQDNGKPEDIAVVRVQEEGTGCGPGLSPVQPSSPYQLGRLGILQRELLLGPDWAAITGINLDEAARAKGLEGFCVAGPKVYVSPFEV